MQMQLLDEVEQNIVICQWRADQLFTEAELRQIIDLRDTDKSRYFAITEVNNIIIIVQSFDHRSLFFLFLFPRSHKPELPCRVE